MRIVRRKEPAPPSRALPTRRPHRLAPALYRRIDDGIDGRSVLGVVAEGSLARAAGAHGATDGAARSRRLAGLVHRSVRTHEDVAEFEDALDQRTASAADTRGDAGRVEGFESALQLAIAHHEGTPCR